MDCDRVELGGGQVKSHLSGVCGEAGWDRVRAMEAGAEAGEVDVVVVGKAGDTAW